MFTYVYLRWNFSLWSNKIKADWLIRISKIFIPHTKHLRNRLLYPWHPHHDMQTVPVYWATKARRFVVVRETNFFTQTTHSEKRDPPRQTQTTTTTQHSGTASAHNEKNPFSALVVLDGCGDWRKNRVFAFLLLPANRRFAFIFPRAAELRIALRTPYTETSLYRITTTNTNHPSRIHHHHHFARVSFFARQPFFLQSYFSTFSSYLYSRTKET